MKFARAVILISTLVLIQSAAGAPRHRPAEPGSTWSSSAETSLKGPHGRGFGTRLAFSGQSGIAVWVDLSNGSPPDNTLRYSLLDAGGTPLNPAGTFLRTSTSPQTPVFTGAVAANGNGFFVAWLEGDGVLATRVSADGTIVDATPIVVPTGAGRTDFVQAACGDRDCLVIVGSVGLGGGGAVMGTLVEANGTVRTPMLLADYSIGVGVAWGLDHYLVVTDSAFGASGFAPTLYATTVTDGIVSAPSPLLRSVTSTIVNPQVSWNGSEWLVTWTDFRGLGLGSLSFDDIRFARLDPSQHWLEASPNGTLIGTIQNQGWSDFPSFSGSEVVWDGKNFAVNWGYNIITSSTRLSRVSPAGQLFDDRLVLPYSPDDFTSLGGGKVLLAYFGYPSGVAMRALSE